MKIFESFKKQLKENEYKYVKMLVVKSNLGSFVKENILNNNFIKEGEDISYYRGIKKILLSNKNGIEKERLLFEFLNKLSR